MGADFNILEYADPELDNITGGEKTNILDLDLEHVEVDPKEDKQKKEVKEEDSKSAVLGAGAVVHAPNQPGESGASATIQPTETPTAPAQQPASLTITPTAPATPQNAALLAQSQAQSAAIQQQMHNHVQQAAAMGRPMAPGTRLMSPDGVVGVVGSNNTVTVSYPTTFPGHPQRISHLQGKGFFDSEFIGRFLICIYILNNAIYI